MNKSSSTIGSNIIDLIEKRPNDVYWTVFPHYRTQTLLRMAFIKHHKITKKGLEGVICNLADDCNADPNVSNTLSAKLALLENDKSIISNTTNPKEYVMQQKLLEDFCNVYESFQNKPEYIMMFRIGEVRIEEPLESTLLLTTMDDPDNQYYEQIIFPTTEVNQPIKNKKITYKMFRSPKLSEFVKKTLNNNHVAIAAVFPPHNSKFEGKLVYFNPDHCNLKKIADFFKEQKIGRYNTKEMQLYTFKQLIANPDKLYIKLRSYIIAELAHLEHEKGNHNKEKEFLNKIGSSEDDKMYFISFLKLNKNLSWDCKRNLHEDKLC